MFKTSGFDPDPGSHDEGDWLFLHGRHRTPGWPPPPPVPPSPPGAPGWPPFGGAMAFRRRGPRVRRGDVRAAILALLAESARNGYQVMQEIAQRSGGLWRPSSGSVYPALQQLEDEGLVAAQEEEGKRTFRLTEPGRAYVQEHAGELAAPWDAVTDTVGDRTAELAGDLGQVSAALMQVGQVGTEGQVEEARRILIRTRQALYELLARGPSDASDRTEPGV